MREIYISRTWWPMELSFILRYSGFALAISGHRGAPTADTKQTPAPGERWYTSTLVLSRDRGSTSKRSSAILRGEHAGRGDQTRRHLPPSFIFSTGRQSEKGKKETQRNPRYLLLQAGIKFIPLSLALAFGNAINILQNAFGIKGSLRKIDQNGVNTLGKPSRQNRP